MLPFPARPFWSSPIALQGCSLWCSIHHRRVWFHYLWHPLSNSWRLFSGSKIPSSGSMLALGPWSSFSPHLYPPCFPAGLDWCKGFLTPQAKHFWFNSTSSSLSQSSRPLWSASQPFGIYSSSFSINPKSIENTLCSSSCNYLNIEQYMVLPAHHLPSSQLQREFVSYNPNPICQGV